MPNPEPVPPVSSYAIGDPPYWQEPYLDENGYRTWLTSAIGANEESECALS